MPLPCDRLIYRILKRKSVKPDGTFKSRDFLLKESDRADGLSVFTSKTNAENCRAELRDMNGIASLHVGHIRDLSDALEINPKLDVINMPEEHLPDHAVIINLPFPYGGNAEESALAEQIASALARMARSVPEGQGAEPERIQEG